MKLQTLLAMLPPPRVLRLPVSLLPPPLLRFAIERAMALALAAPLAAGALEELAGRRLGVEVTDLGLSWVVGVGRRRLEVLPPAQRAEATVRGESTDLLLLATRQEDADTLFFQRRLQVTGDVELGLTVRNLLDQLPWETLPGPLRAVLERGARLACAVREAQSAHGTR